MERNVDIWAPCKLWHGNIEAFASLVDGLRGTTGLSKGGGKFYGVSTGMYSMYITTPKMIKVYRKTGSSYSIGYGEDSKFDMGLSSVEGLQGPKFYSPAALTHNLTL